MIEHTKLQTLITRIKKLSGQRSLKSDIMHPRREWAIGLGVALLLMVCVVGISLYMYTVATTTPQLTAEEVDTVVPYRESAIRAALEDYRVRAVQYQALLQMSDTPALDALPATSTSPASASSTSATQTPDDTTEAEEGTPEATTTQSENSIDENEAVTSADSGSESVNTTPVLAN